MGDDKTAVMCHAAPALKMFLVWGLSLKKNCFTETFFWHFFPRSLENQGYKDRVWLKPY